MSIIIKGMEMPKEESITIQILPSGAVYLNSKLAYEAGAVEIPTPHGRLVDIDKMVDEYWDGSSMQIGKTDIKDIEEYDVVIEAEGSEE